MESKIVLIKANYNGGAIVSLLLPIFFVFSFSFYAANLNSYFFGVFLLLFLMFIIKKGDVFDVVFYISITLFVGVPLISLLKWSSFNTFVDGNFREVFVEAKTINSSISYVIFCILGWWVGSLVKFRIKKIDINSSRSDFVVRGSIFWFSASLFFMILFSFLFDYNIAGRSTTLENSGVYYYAFPIDYLACLFSFAIGFDDEYFLKYKKTLLFLIAGYVVYKLTCGWKSPLLNIFLSFFFGYVSRRKYKEIYKLVFPLLLLLLIYVFVLNPIADYVRGGGGEISSNIYDINPFSNRLTEGTFFGVSLIENNLVKGAFSSGYLFFDFLDRIFPGNLFNQKTLDFYIAQELLGQPDSVQSTFAPGVLGMLAILDDVFLCVLYGFSFRFFINLLILLTYKSNNFILKYCLLGSLPALIIYLCADGYYGGVEKMIVFSVIIYAFSYLVGQRKI
ncbi:hypothetical protein [Comamonas thiooxydans]|uniref:hypothetical protein n=1 Tax=Comamonas thiooxydans TaxID=363952 RepID=UPI000ADEAA96|nr:hypothetical protein [Comamonas thiooxydans]TZG11392.1 hypothetical protein FZC30_05975 [Comamonas thiooxydans]